MDRLDKSVVKIAKLKTGDESYWENKSPIERLQALNSLILQVYNLDKLRIDLSAINVTRLHAAK